MFKNNKKNRDFSLRRNAVTGKGESSVFIISKNKGFTLVELLVTITMFVIITGVVLVNSNKFDSSVLLNNFAYDVALTIKQAQSYGVNVRESSLSPTFDSVYGVFFDLRNSITSYGLFEVKPNDYSKILTADINATCSSDSNCLQKYTMGRGTYIQSICGPKVGGNSCELIDSKLVVMFQRPSLTAKIVSFENDLPNLRDYIEITLGTSDGATSTVKVTSIGQVYVKK